LDDPLHERLAHHRKRLEEDPGNWPAKRELATQLHREWISDVVMNQDA